jgi:hypothetical protein
MGTRGKRRGARLLILAASALVSGPVLPAFTQHVVARRSDQSGPMSYSVNGRQYVTVAAGNSLFAFALRQ